MEGPRTQRQQKIILRKEKAVKQIIPFPQWRNQDYNEELDIFPDASTDKSKKLLMHIMTTPSSATFWGPDT